LLTEFPPFRNAFAGNPNGVNRIIEQGDIFFYRPRVGTDAVDELADVRRFFFILRPDGSSSFRRILVGRKRLPDPAAHERTWAFVAEIAEQPEGLHKELEPTTYETLTRVIRVQPEASYFGTYPGADGLPAAGGKFAVCVNNPTTGTCVSPFHDAAEVNGSGPHGATNATTDIDGGKMDGFIAQS
jgi:hypothetical protein